MIFVRAPYTTIRVIEGISITSAGRIGLPKYFVHLRNIRPGMRAYLYWDSGNQATAISFAITESKVAYPIHFTDTYGAFIQAARFFRANELESMHYRGRYAYQRIPASQVGILDVKSEVFLVELAKPAKMSSGHVLVTHAQGGRA